MELEIKHDLLYKKFFVNLDGKECCLKYDLYEGVIDFKVMFIPRNLRGHGLAEIVTEHAIKHARRNKLKVRPSCSYVKTYFDKHPEHIDILYFGDIYYSWTLFQN